MNIGILSMQRVINFGSFMQTYALKKILESYGHHVNYVDIRKGANTKQPSKPNYIKMLNTNILRQIEHVLFVRKRKKYFETVLFPMASINTPVDESECDAIVIGSDEVFNCSQDSTWGVTTQLYGDVNCPHVLSYAGSFGYTTYEYMETNNLIPVIKDAFQHMEGISVRDNASAECIEKITGRDCSINLDPVLIYDFKSETVGQNIPCKKPYILIYGYDNRIKNESEVSSIKAYAKLTGCRTVSFGVYQRWCDKNYHVSPFCLLECYAKAEAVVTDTFHGTVFAIKQNKPFVTLVRDSNRTKITDLLNRFNLSDRAVSDVNRISEVMENKIDFEYVNKVIEKERVKTREYLSEYLTPSC